MQPDPFGLVEAARILCDESFEVFPYMNDDLIVAERLIEAGCKVLMPWGAPIGSGRGLNNPYALKTMRAHFPDIPLVVDAGIGVPSHAAAAMELGFDAVLINTAVAKAGDPAAMARAFALAVEAGRLAYEADPIEARDMASPSTPSRKGIPVTALDPFYPIFDSADWLERMVPLGIRLVQLRVKDKADAQLRAEIRAARDICAAHDCQLIVNDYWKLALDEGCDFIHLGQEDLDGADLDAIRAGGLKLGVSSHDEAELDRALSVRPDYIALGPIYPTILKR